MDNTEAMKALEEMEITISLFYSFMTIKAGGQETEHHFILSGYADAFGRLVRYVNGPELKNEE